MNRYIKFNIDFTCGLLVSAICFYVIVGFVTWEWSIDVSSWSTFRRGWLAAVSLGGGIITAISRFRP